MHHEFSGGGDGADTLVLCSGLGGSAHYWAPQMAVFGAHFRVLAYDQLGTGRSPATLPAGYTVGDMAAELLALLDREGIARCHFVGHALGGLVGLQIALDRPGLIDRLVVVNGWIKTDPHTLRCFAARRDLLVHVGAASYLSAQPIFLFPAQWLAENRERMAHEEAAAAATFPPTDNVLRRIEAVSGFDIGDRLREVTARTLVVAARDDVLVPYRCSERLAAGLPAASLAMVPEGGHACNITAAPWFDETVVRFLRGAA